VSKLTPQDLEHFTGTTRYYRMGKRYFVTDGTNHLARKAGCFWIMDPVESNLVEIGITNWFIVVRINVEDHKAMIRYLDGNDRELVRQAIPYTDLPLADLTP
jgi:tricorn protease-like protein